MTRFLGLALISSLLFGCEQKAPEPQRPEAPPTRVVGESRPPATPEVERSRLPAADRIVAIGDLHGDLDATRQVLRLAGAIDAGDEWVEGELVVVQTGDQVDRGDEDREVLDLLQQLEARARAKGGALHLLNGNHETMNVAGDFRYVTERSFESFESAPERTLPDAVLRALPELARARAAAFLPGGSYAKKLAEQPVILLVGDTVFVHGGVLPQHVEYGIDRINQEVQRWIETGGQQPRIIASEDSPVWTRLYSEPSPPPAACKRLGVVLERLLVRRMVVGHTVQERGITSACDDRVYRIDVGLSRHYGGDVIAALEIANGKTRVLRAERTPTPQPSR